MLDTLWYKFFFFTILFVLDVHICHSYKPSIKSFVVSIWFLNFIVDERNFFSFLIVLSLVVRLIKF